TFFATAGSIARLGAKPVFVDIDPKTYNIDANKIEKAITNKTKAIIPVHLYGQCADIDPIIDTAKKHNLYIVEDAAQAIGSKNKNRNAGTFGDFGCFSFFPSKNLGGAGDGGLVTTNNEKLYDKLVKLRNHGSFPKYYHPMIGGNFRLDALQAAVLNIKLKYLDNWHENRRNNAAFYDNAFSTVQQIVTPVILPENYSIYNQYVIRVPNRDQIIAKIKNANIGCEIYYPVPLHIQKCFDYLGYKNGDFPESEKAANETLALPIYPELTDEQQQYVADTVIEAVK
ncbi:MAG: transcriptional regulator, partial [Chlamydiae bacterium]